MKRAALLVSTLVWLMLFVVFSPAQAQVSFFHTPTYSGNGPVFEGDFNGDGKPDLLTSDGTLNLGNGDGTYTQGIPVAGGGVLAVADFNGDGKLDILQQGTGTLLVLLGNGDGTFQAPISTPSGAILDLLAASDLNGDGKADVVGVYNSSLIVYISKGDGTFNPGVSYNLSSSSIGFAVLQLGDFNGDSKVDIAVIAGVNNAEENIVLLGNGDGTFQAAKTSSGVPASEFAVTGDFNGDGKLDLVVADECAQSCATFFLAGNGDGTFQTPVQILSDSGPLTTADVNGDGKLDLVLQYYSSPSNLNLSLSFTVTGICLGNGDGTFLNKNNYVVAFPSIYSLYGAPRKTGVADVTNAGPYDIVVADLNGDGKPDIAIYNDVLLGNGDGTFQGILISALPVSVDTLGSAIAVGDFENDGKPDVAALTAASGGTVSTLYILRNDGAGVLSLIQSYPLPQLSSPIFAAVVTGDFNGDGKLDILVSSSDSSASNPNYYVLLGNGDGSFQTPNLYSGFGGTVVADFNNDHKLDLAAVGPNQSVEILLGNGDGTFANPLSYYDIYGSLFLVADFNGDGKLDIVNQNAFLFGNGDGTFQAAVIPPSLSNFPMNAGQLTADFNGDGKPDMLGNTASGVQVALNNGNGTFSITPASDPNFFASEVADMNGDGKPDLFGGLKTSINSSISGFALGNGDGTFGPFTSLPLTGADFPGGVFVDMNGDGRPDIVFSWAFGVGVLFNTTPPNFALAASALSPTAVTAGSNATSTVSVAPTFGFNTTVALSCTGLPTGASCAFTPASITGASGTSMLTITTTAGTAAGTYPVQIQGTAGSLTNTVPVSLVVQAPPDFNLTQASGSSGSQTVSAGQSAKFSLVVAPAGSFSGPVNFTCAITPAATPAPTCTLSSSSVQITNGASQTVTATVATTAPVTTGTVSDVNFPGGMMSVVWTLALLSSTFLFIRKHRRLPVFAPLMILALVALVGCGGSGSSSSTTQHTTPGTPAGTYTVTLTATSNSIGHNTTMQVIVQ